MNIRGASSPSLSASGKLLAFLSNLTGVSQLYITPTMGGEAKQLTGYEDPVIFATFSRVSEEEIIFGKANGGNEKAQLYLLNITTSKVEALTNNPSVKYGFGGWSRDGLQLAFTSNERNGKDFDVFLMDITTKDARCIFDVGGYASSAGFSPKATYLVTSIHESNANNNLFLVDLRTDKHHLITPHDGDATYAACRWLPDESGFYLVSNEGTDRNHLRFFDAAKDSHKKILERDWEITGLSLTWDGDLLRLGMNQDGYSKVEILKTSDLKPIQRQTLPKGMIGGSTWSRDGSLLAFTFNDSKHNTDVWVWGREEDKYWQVTKSPMGVPSEILVEPELHKFKSFDGRTIPAFIYKPQGVKIPPGIINIHGGPEGQFTPSFGSLVQYFVYNGYAVIAPNVRGSSGYGKAYMALDNIEKRMDSVKDIVALRDYLKAKKIVDADRIAVMGGSYGGFMVLACLAFYPDLWAAGVDIAGIANFVTFLKNTSAYRRALREAEYGYLDTQTEFLQSISPLNKVENINAPLFVVHGANDPRVPLSEAEQIRDTLRKRGRKVELLVYPDEGHGLAKLKNRLDAYPKLAKFLDAILK